ncbi:MAG: sulfatase-like hydrolase/transferase [Bacteroidales bacterium]|nr:sulfatase-like hydrolase/transferase [Bacteroidales bacterium]
MKIRLGAVALISRIYIVVLSIFSIYRAVLFFTGIDRLDFSTEPISNVFHAFVMGLRFDIVISGYILFFPALFLFIFEILNLKIKILKQIIFYWTLILFSITFMISASDIPYFNQFFSRFSMGAFEWADNPGFVLKMILEEPKYFIYIILWILSVFIFYKALRKVFHYKYQTSIKNPLVKIVVSLLVLGLMFLGVRGRIEKKSPIRIGTAYFCTNPFLNQLGLNPTFTFLRSYLDNLQEKNKSISLMDNAVAIKNMQSYLNIINPKGSSTISRRVIPDSIAQNKMNVVVIIMESMSAAKMGRYGSTENLTPFLDSLCNESYCFDNIYTAGQHTFNGVFSTLFSYPAIYRQHPMKVMNHYHGMASTLKELGYSTTYFTTHDSQFDNVEGFLRANDFDNIISQSDYPLEEIKTTLGVPDDYLFRYSIPILNKLSTDKKPFFVSFMTASDHGPYYVPDYYKPHSTKVRKQTVEYADWSLRKFINLVSKTDWFDNTIFVFVADHGAAMYVRYDISLNYHHSPLIIYSPKNIKPKLFPNIGGQIDIFPTIMGILQQPYLNTTLGIDLINEQRPYIVINGDDKQAVLDNESLMILKNDNSKSLYKYKKLDLKNYATDFPDKVNDMDKYLRSNLQTFQYIVLHPESINE